MSPKLNPCPKNIKWATKTHKIPENTPHIKQFKLLNYFQKYN